MKVNLDKSKIIDTRKKKEQFSDYTHNDGLHSVPAY